jgi:thymidylate synthase
MHQYLNFLRHILKHGKRRNDRTGIGTISTFGYQMRFDLTAGFPLVTTKKMYPKIFLCELLWFLRGETNIKFLQTNGINIWNSWADSNGDLGPIYGKQWRKWRSYNGEEIDQLSNVLEQIKTNASSRRLIVSAWNVAEIHDMVLPPCHVMFQFYVSDNKLSCLLFQRAGDAFIGVPYNIASYSLLTHMVAKQCNLEVGEFIWSCGDCHIYCNHLSQVELQLSRKPYPLPILKMKRLPTTLFDYEFKDFEFINYRYHSHIKADIAI